MRPTRMYDGYAFAPMADLSGRLERIG